MLILPGRKTEPNLVLCMFDASKAALKAASFPRRLACLSLVVQLPLYTSPVDESLPEHHLISAEPSRTFFGPLGAG